MDNTKTPADLNSITQSASGLEWAAAFKKQFGDNVVDEDTMMGWFANAIETGKRFGRCDHARGACHDFSAQTEPAKPALPEEVQAAPAEMANALRGITSDYTLRCKAADLIESLSSEKAAMQAEFESTQQAAKYVAEVFRCDVSAYQSELVQLRNEVAALTRERDETRAEFEVEYARLANRIIYLEALADHRDRCTDPEVCIDEPVNAAWGIGCIGWVESAAKAKGWKPAHSPPSSSPLVSDAEAKLARAHYASDDDQLNDDLARNAP